MPYVSGSRPKQGTRRRIWDALKAQLTREGTDLVKLVRTWQLGEGDRNDSTLPADWVAAMLPAFRLELEGAQGAWQNQAATKCVMTAAITLGIKGTNQGDALDWWEVVERALYPGDGSFLATLNLLGVNAYTITQAGITRATYANDNGTVITGRITINHEIRTKV